MDFKEYVSEIGFPESFLKSLSEKIPMRIKFKFNLQYGVNEAVQTEAQTENASDWFIFIQISWHHDSKKSAKWNSKVDENVKNKFPLHKLSEIYGFYKSRKKMSWKMHY